MEIIAANDVDAPAMALSYRSSSPASSACSERTPGSAASDAAVDVIAGIKPVDSCSDLLEGRGGAGGEAGEAGGEPRGDLLAPLVHRVNWVAVVLVLINAVATGAYFFYRFTTISELTPLAG
jgi:hypothetical protein